MAKDAAFWRGYAHVTDDLRHTWEQAAYGRPVTGKLTEQEVPGMAISPAQAEEPLSPPPHAHADLYTRIWGAAPNPSPEHSPAPENGTPKIEAPRIEPPRQGSDLTPE